MSTQELTYAIAEGEEGQRLVAVIDIPDRISAKQVAVAVSIGDVWVVILWDEHDDVDQSTASFNVDDRATALQIIDFHAALVTRLIAAQAVTA